MECDWKRTASDQEEQEEQTKETLRKTKERRAEENGIRSNGTNPKSPQNTWLQSQLIQLIFFILPPPSLLATFQVDFTVIYKVNLVQIFDEKKRKSVKKKIPGLGFEPGTIW